MTHEEDRLCVAAALVRHLVSVANVRVAIEEKSKDRPATPVTDILVEWQFLSVDDKETFQRLLRERLDGDPDPDRSLQTLLERQVKDALAVVEDPAVRCFLSGMSSDRDTVEMRSNTMYRLVRIENEGGLGQIWLAAEDSTCRQVAIKRIQPRIREEIEPRRRFLQEAQIIGKLQHPNIVPVYHLGTTLDDGEPYYSMPFIRGRTLEEVVREFHQGRSGRSFDPENIGPLLSIFLKICDAVGYANSCRIIHRDLKPQNIMVGEFGEVFVLDWGLARNLAVAPIPTSGQVSETDGDLVTQCGAVLGSPLYMAPEQAAGRTNDIDCRTDVYGLGGILYKILSGSEPHVRVPNDSLPDHLARIGQKPVRPLEQSGAKVPPALAAVCNKALSIEQDNRYASAGELAVDVRHWLVGNPVSVYREPALQSLARWALRHRRFSSLGAALVVLFVIALSAVFASTWAYAKASTNREVHVLELNHLQVVKSIQGDVKWAFRNATRLADRMHFVDLLQYRQTGNADGEKKWRGIYQPILEQFLGTANYLHALALYSEGDKTHPEFFFQGVPDDRHGTFASVFQGASRPSLEEALGRISQLKSGEKWCSSPIVLHPSQGVPLPVLLGGMALFNNGKRVGSMVTVIDFQIPLVDLADNLHLSVGVTITAEDGIPFFQFSVAANQKLVDAYVNIPPLPQKVVKLIRSNSYQEMSLDYSYQDKRQLACVRTAPILPDQQTPYLGIVLVADYDQLMVEPMEMQWWIAGIVTAVAIALMLAAWIVVRAITLLAFR